MTTSVPVPPAAYSGTVTPPPLQLDLSPTGPYRAAILGSTGSDGSTWQVSGTPPPSVANPRSRWVYCSGTGPSNPHEAQPQGASGMSWYSYGALDAQIPPIAPGTGQLCSAFTGWLMIYPAVGQAAVPGLAFEINGLQTWTVSTAGVFTLAQPPTGQLDAYGNAYNFQGGVNITPTQEDAQTWRMPITPGYIIQAFPHNRGSVAPGQNIAMAYRVRMVLPAGFTGTPPRYIACCGADWWANTSVGFVNPDGTMNPGAFLERFVLVDPTPGNWTCVDGFSGPTVPASVPATW